MKTRKKLILLTILNLMLFASCGTSKNAMNQRMTDYKYINNKLYVYGFDITIPGPYELYVNDFPVRFDYSTGMHNSFIPINSAMLKSGKYNFRLKVYPEPSALAEGGIQPEDLTFYSVCLARYNKTGDKRQSKSYEVLECFDVPSIDSPIPYMEITGDFKVKLPYELEGWSNSRVFTDEDTVWLKPKVEAYYKEISDILNEADIDEWNKRESRRMEETYIFNYTFEKLAIEIEREFKESVLEYYKGTMRPIDEYNYKMVIYGQGRLIRLEITDTTKEINDFEVNARGRSPIFRHKGYNGTTFMPIIIHMPLKDPSKEGEDRWGDFEIIRK